MADRGQITGGSARRAAWPSTTPSTPRPRGSRASARRSPGRAQILVVPDLEAGNMLAKNLTFLAHADAAGIVLGARVPIILTSRADSVRARMASCAVAALYAAPRAKQPSRSPRRERRGDPCRQRRLIEPQVPALRACRTASLDRRLRGQIDGIGVRPRLKVPRRGRRGAGRPRSSRRGGPRPARGDRRDARLACRRRGRPVVAIGHRVVHGGPDYAHPVRIDARVLERLAGLPGPRAPPSAEQPRPDPSR